MGDERTISKKMEQEQLQPMPKEIDPLYADGHGVAHTRQGTFEI